MARVPGLKAVATIMPSLRDGWPPAPEGWKRVAGGKFAQRTQPPETAPSINPRPGGGA